MFTDCVCVSVILSDIDITMCDMTMQAGLDVEKFDAPPWGRIHFYVLYVLPIFMAIKISLVKFGVPRYLPF